MNYLDVKRGLYCLSSNETKSRLCRESFMQEAPKQVHHLDSMPKKVWQLFWTRTVSCADREGMGTAGSGPPPPPRLENYKNIGFLSNTGPDPLKITKLQIQHAITSSN